MKTQALVKLATQIKENRTDTEKVIGGGMGVADFKKKHGFLPKAIYKRFRHIGFRPAAVA